MAGEVERARESCARAVRAVRCAWLHCADWPVGSSMWRFNLRRLLVAVSHLDRRSARLSRACAAACVAAAVERGRRVAA